MRNSRVCTTLSVSIANIILVAGGAIVVHPDLSDRLPGRDAFPPLYISLAEVLTYYHYSLALSPSSSTPQSENQTPYSRTTSNQTSSSLIQSNQHFARSKQSAMCQNLGLKTQSAGLASGLRLTEENLRLHSAVNKKVCEKTSQFSSQSNTFIDATANHVAQPPARREGVPLQLQHGLRGVGRWRPACNARSGTPAGSLSGGAPSIRRLLCLWLSRYARNPSMGIITDCHNIFGHVVNQHW
jgi:hypothetical protein